MGVKELTQHNDPDRSEAVPLSVDSNISNINRWKIWASKRGYIYQLLFEFYFRASVLENTNPVVYYEGFTAHLKCKLCCYKHLLDV